MRQGRHGNPLCNSACQAGQIRTHCCGVSAPSSRRALGRSGHLILFIVARDPGQTAGEIRELVTRTIRTALSPRHVPDQIVTAPAIPRTLTGKKLEIPVKRILQGADPAQVASPDTLANPNNLGY